MEPIYGFDDTYQLARWQAEYDDLPPRLRPPTCGLQPAPRRPGVGHAPAGTWSECLNGCGWRGNLADVGLDEAGYFQCPNCGGRTKPAPRPAGNQAAAFVMTVALALAIVWLGRLR